MDKLTELVTSLTKAEVSALRKYYSSKPSGGDSMRLSLLNQIVKGRVFDDASASRFLKKRTSDPAYIMLKKRLKEDILKVMVWKEDIQKFKSKYFEARYKTRLLITQADLLILKGATKMAVDALNKAKALSEMYELNPELIIINDLLISQVALKKGYEAYSNLAESSKLNFKLVVDKFDAQDYLRQLTMPSLFQVNKDFNYKEKSKEANEKLKILSKSNNSDEIDFWYLRSEVYIHHLKNDYEGANNYAQDFLDLVRKSPVVHSMDNLGGACMQLAIININLKDFANAENYSRESVNSFIKGSNNQLNGYNFLFLSQLYSKELAKAENTIETILKNKAIQKDDFLISKWNYYKANLLFAQGKYEDTLALLQRESELISDKSGWRIGFKILEMICIIELGYFDWLDYRIETFRKLLSDVKNENISRPKIIHQIIKGFIKHMYDFKATSEDLKEHFILLESQEQEYKWDPIGYELIPFHEWWLGKIASKRIVA